MTDDQPKCRVPFSEETPYARAAYLVGMLKAAQFILENANSHQDLNETGVRDLVALAGERALTLLDEIEPIDHPELWAVAQAAVKERKAAGFSYVS